MAKEKSVDVGIAWKNLHDAVHQESNEREDHAVIGRPRYRLSNPNGLLIH